MEKKALFNLKFLKDNKQVIYSIALLVVIPCAVIMNTWFFTDLFNDTIDLGLKDKAVRVGESANVGLVDKLDSPEKMQSFANDWKTFNGDAVDFDIFYRENDSFRLVASMNNPSQVGTTINTFNFSTSWNQGLPIMQKIYQSDGQVNRLYWTIVMPLNNQQGEKQALLSMKLSADTLNEKVAVVLFTSTWMLIITIIFIILLLLANSRLFEYSILYNKIKEIDAMKDEFISMASHELRTPVTVIRGYAEMMLEEADKKSLDAESKDYLSIINISAERLSGLIEDLLNVSRIEQGRMKMEMKDVDAWPTIEGIGKELKMQADQKNLALNCIISPDTKTNISVDVDRFKQVLINIIGNSIKYTPSGSVEVKAKNKDKNLIITIKDTGIGMSSKEREHLFEKFYRVKNNKTSEIVGTGLGLWITKQIIELMQGTISIDSMEGVGTQVTLEFPLKEPVKQ